MFCLFLVAGFSKVFYDSFGFPLLPTCDLLYYENFSDPFVLKRWVVTKHFRNTGKWAVEQSYPLQSRKGERAIVAKTKEKTHSISTVFPSPIYTPNETIVIQYEARAQFLYVCASMKLKVFVDPRFDPADMNNDTARILEFGPERCYNHNQTVLNMFSGDVKHTLKDKIPVPVDEIVHLYTLVLRPNNTFEVLIDMKSMYNGSFIESFVPAFIEPELINDPNDIKPNNWVDEMFIIDESAVKPDDWDENEPKTIPDPKKKRIPFGWLVDEQTMIPDPNAKKPEEWNEGHLGEWKAPMIKNPKCMRAIGCGPYQPPEIPNPKYKGKWTKPLINNPRFIGQWKPKQINNPKYLGPQLPFSIPPIIGIGFDIWGAHHDIMITNVLISNNESIIKRWNKADFNGRQKRQIKAMKIAYDWINVDEEEEIIYEPSLTSYFSHYTKKTMKWWSKVDNKPAVIAIIVSAIMILIPVVFLCYELFTNDTYKEKIE